MEPQGRMLRPEVIDKGRVHTTEHTLLGSLEIFLAGIVVAAEAAALLLNQDDGQTERPFWYPGFWAGGLFFFTGILGVATAAAKSRPMTFLCAVFGLASAAGAGAAVTFSAMEVMEMEDRYKNAFVKSPLKRGLAIGYATEGILMGACGVVVFIALIQVGYSLRDLCFPSRQVMAHLLYHTPPPAQSLPVPVRHQEVYKQPLDTRSLGSIRSIGEVRIGHRDADDSLPRSIPAGFHIPNDMPSSTSVNSEMF